MTELTILDVGHGNCALIRSSGEVAVVDAPTRSLLLDTLRDMGIATIDAAFISHADKDHLAGIVGLLTSKAVRVRTLYVNADAGRRSRLWGSLLAAIAVAERDDGLRVVTSLSAATPGQVPVGRAMVHVVAPSTTLTLRGVGGVTADERPITANALSAVLRIEHLTDGQGVLLAGDMDEIGLLDAIANRADLRARVLVFPHHGGSPNGDAAAFTADLLAQVNPAVVVFSNGRNRYDNPQPNIVSAVRARGCGVACTQMSKNCSADIVPLKHLEDVRAHGRSEGLSCAGSMTLDLVGGAERRTLASAQYEAFIDSDVPTPMCRQAPRQSISEGEPAASTI